MSDDLNAKSQEFKEGFCCGFNQVLAIIQQNRAHYRALLGQPEMTHAEVLDWIYARPWCDGPTQCTAPRRIDQPPGEPTIGPPAIESVDLYLIPSITECTIGPDGNIVFKMHGWERK